MLRVKRNAALIFLFVVSCGVMEERVSQATCDCAAWEKTCDTRLESEWIDEGLRIACYSDDKPVPTPSASVDAYHMHWPPSEDWSTVASLGIDTIVVTMNPDRPGEWTSLFDQAIEEGLRLIVALWPLPYNFVGAEANIDAALPFFSFLNSNTDYRAQMFALWGNDEPYWQGCYGCGWTTEQMVNLRTAIREVVPDLPIYYDMGDLAFWEDRCKNRASPFYLRTCIDDAAYDYLAIYFRANMTPEEIQIKLNVNRTLLDGANSLDRPLEIRLVSFLNSYQLIRGPYNIPMPTYDDILRIGRQIIGSGAVDTYGYYPWCMDIYDDCLSKHRELWPAIKEVIDG